MVGKATIILEGKLLKTLVKIPMYCNGKCTLRWFDKAI